MRLFPWMRTKNGYIWQASFAIAKSNRQLNDWSRKKLNKRANKLRLSLTGKAGVKTHVIAIRQIRDWMKQIPIGDSIAIRCTSSVSDKQFKICKKWFLKHESKEWIINDKNKAFFFYRVE